MIQATGSNILVKVIYKETSETIIIPDTSKKQHQAFYGRVIAVGPDYLYDVVVDDKVVFQRGEGFKIFVGDEEYLALKEVRVLCVIED